MGAFNSSPEKKKDLPCKGLDINPKLAVLEKSAVITEVAISGVNMIGVALKVSLIGYPLGSILMGLSNIIAVGVKKYNENVKLDSLFRELMFIIFSIKMLFINEIKKSSPDNKSSSNDNKHWEKTMYNIKYHLVNISLIINKLIGIKKRGNNEIKNKEADCKEIIADIKKADPDSEALTEQPVAGGAMTDMLTKFNVNIPFVNSVLKPDIFIGAIHDELTLLNSYLILHIQSNSTINDDDNVSKKDLKKLLNGIKEKIDDVNEQISELEKKKQLISDEINENNGDEKNLKKLNAKKTNIDATINKLNEKITKLKEDESKYNTSSDDLDKIRDKLNNTIDITELVKEFESDLSGYEENAKKFIGKTVDVAKDSVTEMDKSVTKSMTDAVNPESTPEPNTESTPEPNTESNPEPTPENKSNDNETVKKEDGNREPTQTTPNTKTGGKLRHSNKNTRKKHFKSTQYKKTYCNKNKRM